MRLPSPLQRLPDDHQLGLSREHGCAGRALLNSGTPKSYVKTAESGNKRRQVFCSALEWVEELAKVPLSEKG